MLRQGEVGNELQSATSCATTVQTPSGCKAAVVRLAERHPHLLRVTYAIATSGALPPANEQYCGFVRESHPSKALNYDTEPGLS